MPCPANEQVTEHVAYMHVKVPPPAKAKSEPKAFAVTGFDPDSIADQARMQRAFDVAE